MKAARQSGKLANEAAEIRLRAERRAGEELRLMEERGERAGRGDAQKCLLADGFDDAIIGVVEGCGRPTVICYDYEKCVEVLMRESHMDEEVAREYLEFNTVGAYVGGIRRCFCTAGAEADTVISAAPPTLDSRTGSR